jgi:ATP-dependent Clp protease ATP-binding subunit ClpC
MIQKSLKQQFNPEFLNRIDDVILFNSLKEDSLLKIVSLEIDKLVIRLKEKKFDITFDETVLKEIISRNKEEQYGARPIKRIIQSLCEDFLSDEILRGTIIENQPVIIEYEDKLMVKS